MQRTAALIILVMSLVLILLVFSSKVVTKDDSSATLEMEVRGIDFISNSPVVVLRDKDGKRSLRIYVGINEATAIVIEMESADRVRPLTHDLMKNLLDGVKATVNKIVVNDLRDNIFYATIYLSHDKKTVTIDSRPSDAIALALRAKAPIFVAKHVLDAAGIDVEPGEAEKTSFLSEFGFSGQDISPELAKVFQLESTEGVLVSQVDDDSAAEKAGLIRTDIIIRANDTDINNFDDLNSFFSKIEGSEKVSLTVRRDEDVITLDLGYQRK